MPLQPPTRPHSANPHVSLRPSLFASNSESTFQRVTSQGPRHITTGGYRRHGREGDWEDAWDSSSDTEADIQQNNVEPRLTSTSSLDQTAEIPMPRRDDSTERNEDVISSSWASASYHNIPTSPTGTSSPSSIHRPQISSSKTYTDGATPPPPGTHVVGNVHKKTASGSKSSLPPGGAWEIVEPAELKEEAVEPKVAGKEAVRDDLEDILKDPLQLLSSLSLSAPSTPVPAGANPSSSFPFLSPGSPSTSSSAQVPAISAAMKASTSTPRTPSRSEGLGRARSVRTERRRDKFAKVLQGRTAVGGSVELGELRRLAWSGVPDEIRPIVWQLLLNYLPLPSQPRLATLQRKRKEYSQLVDQYFGRGLASLDQQIWHQIEIDVPRTRPRIPLWSCVTAQRALERILYVWAIRHPASGYVQGINDLVCPFFQVFLSAYIDTDPELFDVVHLPANALSAIEADTFWCLSKLLDGIQDNYISHQPGIQRLVQRMRYLVRRIDAPLAAHFEDQGVEYMQFAFRWMNCLLMREISVKGTIRMWDTYLAEGTDAFSQFHLYVCSALLVKFSDRLREMDFQEMIIFLQCLPTSSWTDHDIELLLSEAYVLKTVWQGAENHFANLPNGQEFGMLGR
ncbi:rab-GTPase-TBC domain-domain-containing protein [Kockovaella imperatae]|uniref:Rab-GTPase-TBC domain-domain-containing protein n=1 Tax=Kockovaella imperatae TaxID=4999 RepID=A0A1Y1UBA1_9TREE|nr:rab-GTPase-TBC domain-domain-containing protein [Kockovaella imperatae]ORX34797.1 rab-GTPase-TBC domain-domain-containing protein [Kockovaella imperatae]